MSLALAEPTSYTRLMGGKYWVKSQITEEPDLYKVKFGFSRPLIADIKALDGSRWNPEEKCWTLKKCEHNDFQLAYLGGKNPYAWFDRPLLDVDFVRPLYLHQKDLVRSGLTYHFQIWAAEKGCGKSLAAIEVMERSGEQDWLYVGPRSAIASFELELSNWKSRVWP